MGPLALLILLVWFVESNQALQGWQARLKLFPPHTLEDLNKNLLPVRAITNSGNKNSLKPCGPMNVEIPTTASQNSDLSTQSGSLKYVTRCEINASLAL